ncbi:MAG: hypothetical protein J6S67_12355 [Methanobrevibacter sp.]|nr:hypothetical protein [Methanobrevibacter sp.]
MTENVGDMTQASPKSDVKTVRYICNCTCYWNDILYHVDDTVEVPANVTPPKEYFDKI